MAEYWLEMDRKILTCRYGGAGRVGAGELLQVAFQGVGALDVVAGVPAPAQGTPVVGEGESVRAEHPASVVGARFGRCNKEIYEYAIGMGVHLSLEYLWGPDVNENVTRPAGGFTMGMRLFENGIH